MSRGLPFEKHTERYDRWFEAHEAAYASELEVLRQLRPSPRFGLEIGVGSGRFGAPLGIDVGVDPARSMLEYARKRGIQTVRGVAESLPFADNTFDTAVLVTTICFVDDISRTLSESARVLGSDGALVIGYVDENSPLGQRYEERKSDNPFYQDAAFVSTDDILEELRGAGFRDVEFVQTLFHWPPEMEEPDPVKSGSGEGSFVGIRAEL